MSVPNLDDLLPKALGRVPSQWGDGTVMKELVRIAAGELVPLASFVRALVEERSLDTAVGAQLDQWGLLLGVQRLGLDDIEYRAALKARKAVLASDGTPEVMISILSLLTGSNNVTITEEPSAYVMFTYVLDEPDTDAERAATAASLQSSAPAGVQVALVEAPAVYFGFEGDAEAEGFGAGTLSYKITG